MALYDPERPELGKNAISRRVNALRAMNKAGGPQYRRYDRAGAAPAYQVQVPTGEVRKLATRDVPAYVVGQADAYVGVRAQLREALDAALSDRTVTDRDSLVERVVTLLDERCGEPLSAAAAYFAPDERQWVAVDDSTGRELARFHATSPERAVEIAQEMTGMRGGFSVTPRGDASATVAVA